MKQLALQQLLSHVFGTPRYGGRFDVSRWDEVEDETVSDHIQAVFAKHRKLALVDGRWPGVWISVLRESLEEFKATYPDEEDGELEAYREEEFPKAQWIRIDAHEDDRERTLFLYPMGVPLIYRTAENLAVVPAPWNDETRENLCRLLKWLKQGVSSVVDEVLRDPASYHDRLEANLPQTERLGWFRRGDLWSAAPAAEHIIKSELNEEERTHFAHTAADFTKSKPLQNLIANDYLRFCKICYRGARYEGLAGLSPREQYKSRADGRHDGLLDLEPDSPEALAEWSKIGSRGGHPWEIARGGNTTHISLYLRRDDDGYHLSLEGTAPTRAAETIRMALALNDAKVPVKVHDIELHRKRALGEDLIAIVPTYYVGAYAYTIQSLFPNKVEVHDHVSHGIFDEYPDLIRFVRWLPLPKIEPAV